MAKVAVDVNARACLVKPFDFAVLRQTIRDVLRSF
jgi:DNA-binding response OmpR family regulator